MGGADQLFDLDVAQERNSIAFVQLCECLADGLTDCADEWNWSSFDDRHVCASVSCGRRELGPDESSANYHELCSGEESFAERECIIDRAERENAVQIRGVGQRAWRRACRDDQLLVGNPIAVSDSHTV